MFAHHLILVLAFHAFPSLGLDCGDGKIRGVNVGGWLLLEPWITPKLFEEVNVGDNVDKIVDEWTYAEFVRTADEGFYNEKLDRHWDTYVTYQEFQQLSEAGDDS